MGVLLVRVIDGKCATWAWRFDPGVELRLCWDGRGHGDVLGGSEGASEVADVSTEKDKCMRCGADEGRDMANGMAGDVEDVEAAIAEIVVGLEVADLELV